MSFTPREPGDFTMACTLVVRGRDFDVQSLASRTPLPISSKDIWVRGTPHLRGKPPHEDSGFSIWVTRDRDEWNDLEADIEEVLKFLKQQKGALETLIGDNGVEHVMLDFALQSRAGTAGVFMHGEYFPPELLKVAGNLNIGIALSLYPAFEVECEESSADQ